MDMELRDKAFLITGGTDGLGLALAKTLVREGAQVAVCGRDQTRLEEAASVLGSEALCMRADVSKATELDAFIDTTLTSFGRLDGVVNNAGRSAGTSIATSVDQEWRDDYELKVIAAMHLARRVLPALEASRGALLNVLAIMARTPSANSTPTTASRAAGLAFTKAMANEVGPGAYASTRSSLASLSRVSGVDEPRTRKPRWRTFTREWRKVRISPSDVWVAPRNLRTSPRFCSPLEPVTSPGWALISTADFHRSSEVQ